VSTESRKKRKNINDPVYGFITIPDEMMFDLVEHPWFQRLRRIRQLGLTLYVYPSATHSRFQHALGAMYLMRQCLQLLRSKDIVITKEEEDGVLRAILLHDIGHGPFSHALEATIIKGMGHEELSLLFMEELNRQFGGALYTAIRIFKNEYPKRFLHQLVSSQLDMDRLDYLSRDSFFTGVSEGVINTDRIIQMLTVVDDELVVEAKGIYSIEKFILARRLMYWQVYLHKTVLSADRMLLSILRRAQDLSTAGEDLFATPALHRFLRDRAVPCDAGCLPEFARLDDNDIISSIKAWIGHPDPILSMLCTSLTDRRLFRVEMRNEPFDPAYVEEIRRQTGNRLGLTPEEASYFVLNDSVTNDAYTPGHDLIRVVMKDGRLLDVAQYSEELNISVLQTTVRKYVLCYPKSVDGETHGVS
jgi:HD superfamily phosphohydrolase